MSAWRLIAAVKILEVSGRFWRAAVIERFSLMSTMSQKSPLLPKL